MSTHRSSAIGGLLMLALAGTGSATSRAEDAPALFLAGSEGADGAARSEIRLAEGGLATLEHIRNDPLASEVVIAQTSRDALGAVLRRKALAIAARDAQGRRDALTFHGAAVTRGPDGTVSLYAENLAEDSAATLVIDGLDILGSMRRGHTTWNIRPLGEGRTAIFRYDTSKLRRHPPGGPGRVDPRGLPRSKPKAVRGARPAVSNGRCQQSRPAGSMSHREGGHVPPGRSGRSGRDRGTMQTRPSSGSAGGASAGRPHPFAVCPREPPEERSG